MQKKLQHFQPGYNIAARAKQDQKQQEYADYAKKISAIGRTTEWHETQKKYEVQKANKASELSIQQELKEAN